MRLSQKVSVFGVLVLLLVGAIIHGPPKIPADSIANSVTRTDSLMDQAYSLPVGKSYGRDMHYQSNGGVCGAASPGQPVSVLGRKHTR